MAHLLQPLKLREITFRNRIFVSPMCQYSSEDGFPSDWHLVHLGSRAVGGAGLVMVEASAVSPEGRISPADSGMWSIEHANAYRRIANFIKQQHSIPGIQIAHAGRKASTEAPWRGGKGIPASLGGWQPLAPSAIAFDVDYPLPREMSADDLENVVDQFTAAAGFAIAGGFEVVEIHMAHGYLLHEFLSPLSNRRNDDYGGCLENRMRLPLRVAEAVRRVVPAMYPVFARISASDWADGGWDLSQSVELCRQLKLLGIDLIDCSSGGLVPHARIELGPGYQVPFAQVIRAKADIPTGAVGMITTPEQAQAIVASGEADAVLLAREFLRDPYFPLRAAHVLGAQIDWPVQYGRAQSH